MKLINYFERKAKGKIVSELEGLTGPPAATRRPAFPRAILGLPINFHFADGPNGASKAVPIAARDRDPDKPELRPVGFERMASPVLTRPVLVNGKWHAAILILLALRGA